MLENVYGRTVFRNNIVREQSLNKQVFYRVRANRVRIKYVYTIRLSERIRFDCKKQKKKQKKT